MNKGLTTLDIKEEVNNLVAEESEVVTDLQVQGAFGFPDWGAVFKKADLSAAAFIGFNGTAIEGPSSAGGS